MEELKKPHKSIENLRNNIHKLEANEYLGRISRNN